MQYLGGKYRCKKPIAQKIGGGGGTLVSLFCGACNVESVLAPRFERVIINDKHEYLIAALRAVQAGWQPPTSVSEEEYRFIKAHKDLCPALTGFVGFACSFGGKWFDGYAREDKRDGRNYADVGARGLLRDMKPLKNAEILCMDYRDVPIPLHSVIYADPPYLGTTKYKTDGGAFDSTAFWEYMRTLSRAGHDVYISEQAAPDDFECIWEKPLKRQLCVDKDKHFMATEKLFKWKGD